MSDNYESPEEAAILDRALDSLGVGGSNPLPSNVDRPARDPEIDAAVAAIAAEMEARPQEAEELFLEIMRKNRERRRGN